MRRQDKDIFRTFTTQKRVMVSLGIRAVMARRYKTPATDKAIHVQQGMTPDYPAHCKTDARKWIRSPYHSRNAHLFSSKPFLDFSFEGTPRMHHFAINDNARCRQNAISHDVTNFLDLFQLNFNAIFLAISSISLTVVLQFAHPVPSTLIFFMTISP